MLQGSDDLLSCTLIHFLVLIQDKESARSLVTAAQGTVEEVAALLQDARLTAPESGQISAIFPKRGELVGAGMPIMNLVVLDDVHVVLNVREDRLPLFKMGGTFVADVPAIDKKDIEFKINYISPLGSFATWKSTKQTGSYDLRTFEIHALPDSIKGVDRVRTYRDVIPPPSPPVCPYSINSLDTIRL